MKPPRCRLCGAKFDLSDRAGLLYFARRPSDQAWHERAEAEPGFTGHPPNAAWFCQDHFTAARTRTGLTIDVAMAKLRAVAEEE
ncbi:hypothetical protein ACFL59_03415 [Planctomycetota bacterium]